MGGELIRRDHRLDLWMRAKPRKDFIERRLALRWRQRLRKIIVAAVAIKQRLGEAELFGDRLADLFRIKRRVEALRVGPGVLPIAFGKIVPAMIGGERHDIINAGCIDAREEIAKLAVERQHLRSEEHTS